MHLHHLGVAVLVKMGVFTTAGRRVRAASSMGMGLPRRGREWTRWWLTIIALGFSFALDGAGCLVGVNKWCDP